MSDSLCELNEAIDETLNRLNSLKQLPENDNQINCLHRSLALLYNNRGFIYYKKVEFNLAADDYTTAIAVDPSLAIAHYNRGSIHYRMNHFESAFNDFKSAIGLEPNNSDFRLAFDQSLDQINK